MKIPAVTVELPVTLQVGDGDPQVIGHVPVTLTGGDPEPDIDDTGRDTGAVVALTGDGAAVATAVADLLTDAAAELRARTAG